MFGGLDLLSVPNPNPNIPSAAWVENKFVSLVTQPKTASTEFLFISGSY